MSETTTTNLLRNPGFEDELGYGVEQNWVITGASDDDTWAFDTEVTKDGGRSLRFEPKLQGVATQIVTEGCDQLEGKKVTVSADIRQDDANQPPMLMVMAFNDALPKHPVYQTGLAGVTQVVAPPGRDGRFVRYSANFVATAPAERITVTLLGCGTAGKVWFDNVSLEISDPE